MDPKFLASVLVKWLHLSSAVLLVGGAAYLRILHPLLESNREAWIAVSRKTYRWMVAALGMLLLTGLDNVVKAQKTLGGLSLERQNAYWTAFGIKMILFLAATGLIHLLLIRAPAFGAFQDRPKPWLSALAFVAFAILLLSGYLTLTRMTMIPVR